jgi:hypothetical protein
MAPHLAHDSGELEPRLVDLPGGLAGELVGPGGRSALPVVDIQSQHPLEAVNGWTGMSPSPPASSPHAGATTSGGPRVASSNLRADQQEREMAERIAPHAPRAAGEFWLRGDVILCACPECRAPMSIRLWLMLADCWNCGTSIELSEAQERAVRRLLAQRAAASTPATAPPAVANSVAPPVATGPVEPLTSLPSPVGLATTASEREQTPALPKPTEPVRSRAESKPSATAMQEPRVPLAASKPAAAIATAATSVPVPTVARALPASPTRAATQAVPARAAGSGQRKSAAASSLEKRLQRAKADTVQSRISDLFGTTPAWLMSLVFHLILLTILALITWGTEEFDPYITLSTTVAKEVKSGGEVLVVDPQAELAFDLPLPRDTRLEDQQQREAIIKADQEARELRLDPTATQANLPQLSQVKSLVGGTGGGGIGRALAARDPRIRVEMVKQEGGTTLTEAAVARGLRWLAQHQSADGSWSLDRFNHPSGCTCTRPGGMRTNAGGTALALLPFLGAGQTHLVGRYQETVARGLQWLLKHQRPDGDLRADSTSNSGMYVQGQATIVLCEAFFMTGDEQLRKPAQKAIDFIVAAQHVEGGWRYRPGEPGDTSVLGWQLMALQSGRAANLDVPAATLERAGHYLDSVQHQDGTRYSYQRGRGPDHVMTAEALLCRMYLGWNLDQPGLRSGVQHLLNDHMPKSTPNLYYWYYATQVMHHAGGSSWERWNLQMREILVERQKRSGHEAGSWDPEHSHDVTGGRLYATSLATCTLEVYYRHLPLFRQIELSDQVVHADR